jgi:hypothetical protein
MKPQARARYAPSLNFVMDGNDASNDRTILNLHQIQERNSNAPYIQAARAT